MKHHKRFSLSLSLYLFSACVLALSFMPTGCGGAPQEATSEPTKDASSTPDTAKSDTGTPDVAKKPDVGAIDTGKPDTGKPDTGTPDLGKPDAGPADTGPDATPDMGKPDEAGTTLSYATHIKDLFQRANCSNGYCHGGGSGGLTIKDGQTYGNLVNQKSTKGTWTRVVPGDPEKSLLYEKITKEQPAEGSKMPIGSTLTSKDITLIRDWIKSGAKP